MIGSKKRDLPCSIAGNDLHVRMSKTIPVTGLRNSEAQAQCVQQQIARGAAAAMMRNCQPFGTQFGFACEHRDFIGHRRITGQQ
jgi:hypothetical protein